MLLKLPIHGSDDFKSITVESIKGLDFSFQKVYQKRYLDKFSVFRLNEGLLKEWRVEEIKELSKYELNEHIRAFSYRPELRMQYNFKYTTTPDALSDLYNVEFVYYKVPKLEIIYDELNGEIKGSGYIKGGRSQSSRTYAGLFSYYHSSSGSSWVEGESKLAGKISGVRKLVILGTLAIEVNKYLEESLGVKSFLPKE